MQTSRPFRIFVSSTFNDRKAERNTLQERVFPRLRSLAESHGCRFQAIDLRWESAGNSSSITASCIYFWTEAAKEHGKNDASGSNIYAVLRSQKDVSNV